MAKSSHSVFMGAVLGTALILAGCGHTTNTSNGASTSLPRYTNLLTVENHGADQHYDPTPGSAKIYDNIVVYNRQGQKVSLSVKNHPILFEAYWCPHCQRTLVLLNSHRTQLYTFPTIVSMGFPIGTTLAQAIKISDEEMADLHIHNVTVYFGLGVAQKNWVKWFPTLAYNQDGNIMVLTQEHSFSAWQKAIGAS